MRALTLCADEVLDRTLQRALRSFSLEPISLNQDPSQLGALDASRDAVAIFDVRHPDLAVIAAAVLLRVPDIRRIFLCGEQDPPTLHENDAVLRGAFSLAEFKAAIAPIQGRPLSRASTPLVLNLEQLLDCARGEPEELERMVDLFLSGAEAQLARARAALAQGNLDEVHHACHRLCGAAATAGAEELALRCREVMVLLEAQGVPVTLDPLERALSRFRDAYWAWRRAGVA
ncbi:MAG: Hpt domain-containing protein [Polyangiaceae bacterium]|jgi:HPt (histidine-containing phosphotransfer) domain-containing protein|nr:Hpt domain-containing protein [Polyangiaceae bacterium]